MVIAKAREMSERQSLEESEKLEGILFLSFVIFNSLWKTDQ